MQNSVPRSPNRSNSVAIAHIFAFCQDIYSGSQESEVCPMPCLANALFGQCPVWPMPDEHLMLLRKAISHFWDA